MVGVNTLTVKESARIQFTESQVGDRRVSLLQDPITVSSIQRFLLFIERIDRYLLRCTDILSRKAPFPKTYSSLYW